MEPVYLFGISLAIAVYLWVRSARGLKKVSVGTPLPVDSGPDHKALLHTARVELDGLRTRLFDLEGQLTGANTILQESAPYIAFVALLETGSLEDAEAACPGATAVYPRILGDPRLNELLLELLPIRRQRLIAELTDIIPDIDSADCMDFSKSVSRCRGAELAVKPEPTRPVEPRELKRQWGGE